MANLVLTTPTDPGVAVWADSTTLGGNFSLFYEEDIIPSAMITGITVLLPANYQNGDILTVNCIQNDTGQSFLTVHSAFFPSGLGAGIPNTVVITFGQAGTAGDGLLSLMIWRRNP